MAKILKVEICSCDFDKKSNFYLVTYDSGKTRKFGYTYLATHGFLPPKTVISFIGYAVCSYKETVNGVQTVVFEEPDYMPETASADEPETIPAEITPEQQENVETVPEEEITSYPLDVPDDMRIKSLCRKCKHLESCFYENRSKVLEDVYRSEPCDDVCGECTLCCNKFLNSVDYLQYMKRRYHPRE